MRNAPLARYVTFAKITRWSGVIVSCATWFMELTSHVVHASCLPSVSASDKLCHHFYHVWAPTRALFWLSCFKYCAHAVDNANDCKMASDGECWAINKKYTLNHIYFEWYHAALNLGTLLKYSRLHTMMHLQPFKVLVAVTDSLSVSGSQLSAFFNLKP